MQGIGANTTRRRYSPGAPAVRSFYSALVIVFVCQAGLTVCSTSSERQLRRQAQIEAVPLRDSTTPKTVVLWRMAKVVHYGALKSSLPPERAVEVVDTRCNLAHPKSLACQFVTGAAGLTAGFWIPVLVVVAIPVVLVQKLGESGEVSPEQRYAHWVAQTLRGADEAALDSKYFSAFFETLGWPLPDPAEEPVREDIAISITRVAFFESAKMRPTVLLCGRAALVGFYRPSGEIREIEVCQAHEVHERPLIEDTEGLMRLLLPAAEALGRAQARALTVQVPHGRALKVEGIAETKTTLEAPADYRVNCVSRGIRRWTHPSQCD